ncbi:Ig-like domain-containing protein [Cellvibrio mixtus]|uniref:Ig-like domain-containing protein n=1 Tax=Cellvibrio mixtus TaxID=39650 RepID=UPI000587ACD4|nr:Ig-like domain-containing protein [Cellvibrio mixtus]
MKNKSARQILIVASLVGITACGGSGGGSGNGGRDSSSKTTTTSSSIISTSSSDISSQSAISSSLAIANENPTVSILFPRQNARVNTSNITVQGIATDDKGINKIRVNGVDASFHSTTAINAAMKSVRGNEVENAITGFAKPYSGKQVTVAWTANIHLPFGQTDINVEVIDNDGGTTKNSDKPVSLSNYRVPLALIKDTTNNRFISFEQYPNIFSVDMTSLLMTTLPDSRYEQGWSLSADSSKVFSVANEGGVLKVYSSKIATGLISLEAIYDLQFDASQHNWISVSGTLSADSKFYFALAYYVSHDNKTTSKILKVDLESNQVSVLSERAAGDDNYKHITSIVYVDNYLIGTLWRNDLRTELIKIDAITGVQQSFIDPIAFNHLSVSDDRKYLYLLGNDNFAKVKIADKSIEYTHFHEQQDMLEFAQQSGFVIDEKHNRLVVSDPGLGQLVAVDLTSAELSFLTENGIGAGPKLVWPDQLAITSDNKFAYVLDDRLDAKEMLFKIDLATGNRKVISDLSIYDGERTAALAIDEEHNRAFVAFGLTIGVIDLTTGKHEIIANQSIGIGPIIFGVADMVYDNVNDRLLVASSAQELVVSIDLKTNKRSILFDGTTGSGPALMPMASLALDKQNNQLYASITKFGELTKVIAIDMATGDRAMVLESCNGHTLDYKYDANLELDPARQTLTMLANNELFKYDLAKKMCSVLPVSALDIAFLSDSTLLGVSGHGLYQINPENGERVTISQ